MKTTIHRHTCDLCGKTVDASARTDFPSGWGRYGIPRHSIKSTGRGKARKQEGVTGRKCVEICVTCTMALADFAQQLEVTPDDDTPKD